MGDFEREELIKTIKDARTSGIESGDFGMFSEEGNRKVVEIVLEALGRPGSSKSRFNYAMDKLRALGEFSDFEEATDTEVRDRVFQAVQ